MKSPHIVLWFLLLQLASLVSGEIFGRRRQVGARRRSGVRPPYGVQYGLSYTVWYIILAVGLIFLIALAGSILYYCLVIKKRNRKKREAREFKPIGGGYDMRTKEQKDREMEEYLAKVSIPHATLSYHDFEMAETTN